jgi:glycosyltransferase 2 family protein
MRIIPILALLVGLAVGTLLVGHYGFAAVGHAMLAVGWGGFLAIVLLHLGMIALCGVAWWAVLPPAQRPAIWIFIWGRLARDAGSEVLPLSQIGGYVIGARATALAGLPGTIAFASTMVDVTMELLGQLAYTALGLGIVSVLHPEVAFVTPVALGLAAAVLVAVAFISAQQRGFALMERLANRLAREWAAAAATNVASIQAAIHAIYARRRGLLAGSLLHLVSWIVSAAEPWLALKFMGAPLGFGPVLAIESLLYAARSVAFAVPNAVGVQEGAYILLGGLFGLGPDTALALSLLKRSRDLALGVPALLAWQFIEGERAWRLRPAALEDRQSDS